MIRVDDIVSGPPPPPAGDGIAENQRLAARLRDYADLLEAQEANPFRVRAYQKAADVVDRLAEPVSAILSAKGREGLDALPSVGPRISAALAEMARTGRWWQLDRLRGQLQPEALFRTIPGIGPALAHRLVEDLHLSSLEALEAAAHDGRLALAAGWGPRRIRMIKSALAERLGRTRMDWPSRPARQPAVAALLEVDRAYREAAEAGRLRRIAPRRFNPSGKAWLPVLHTEREPWRFTALYSNTPLAHGLGRTRDWVVIYYEADDTPEGRCTVVTETQGPLRGRRVVRGRETETPDRLATEGDMSASADPSR